MPSQAPTSHLDTIHGGHNSGPQRVSEKRARQRTLRVTAPDRALGYKPARINGANIGLRPYQLPHAPSCSPRRSNGSAFE